MRKLVPFASFAVLCLAATASAKSTEVGPCMVSKLQQSFYFDRNPNSPDLANIESATAALFCVGRQYYVSFSTTHPRVGRVRAPKLHIVPEGTFARWVRMLLGARLHGKKLAVGGDVSGEIISKPVYFTLRD